MTDFAQNTSTKIPLKVYLSGTATDATGKTVAVTISKNGAAFANPNAGATNATEIGNGWYYFTADTTDTGTVGLLIVRGTAAACDNSEAHHYVVNATNGRMTAIPTTAITTNGSLLTAGTGTSQIDTDGSGRVNLGKALGTAVTLDANNVLNVSTKYVAGTTQTAGDLVPLISGIGTAGGAAINIDAATNNSAGGISGVTSGTTMVGTQTAGTYLTTSILDGIYNTITGSATAFDIVYQFLTGGGTSPVALTWHGYLNGANDSGTFYAWNHVGAAWEIIGSIEGQAGTVNVTKTLTLYSRHRGTSAAELGKVYIRLAGSSITNPVLNTDQIYTSYAVTSRSVGYANGAIWVDTVNGTAGTESFVNGVADAPVLTWADALTIGAALNIHTFITTPDSSITLSASSESYYVNGRGGVLALGTQNIGSTLFSEFTSVTGVGTSTGGYPIFRSCSIGAATLPPSILELCALTSTLTIGSAGSFLLVDCFSGIAGSGAPTIDLGAAIGATDLSVRRWSGGLTFANVKAGDVVSVDVVSGGTITVGGTGGSVNIRGICSVTDSSGGTVTITQTSVVNMTKINTEADTALTDYAATVLEGTLTRDQAQRIILSGQAGKLSGAATATNTFRDTADTKNRIVSTVDSDGNRSAVTLDGT